MEEITKKPTSINTWGDAIFAVMENASELAEYALQLSRLVPEISKNTRGLPPISIRTSLHAGPVYEATDPFRKQTNFYGGHINRAARLEPVTVVGEVYATEQFMALLIAEQSSDRVEKTQKGEPYVERFTCDYVGVMALAKGFGEQPVYHLRWF
jgi:class 3 adenylate cyclase